MLMLNSIEISFMTSYLLKNILSENRDNIRPIRTSIQISVNVSEIDIEEILVSAYNDSAKIAFCIKQLEALVRVYQIHKKQDHYQDLNKLRSQIFEILGYQKVR